LALKTMKRQMNPAVFQLSLKKMLELYSIYRNQFKKIDLGRVELINSMIDNAVSDSPSKDIQCGKGCAACCHMEVMITTDEAAVLAQRIRAGINIDEVKLELQAEVSEEPGHSHFWTTLLTNENRCVFLSDEKTCRIYEHRPSACRKHLVTSSPMECSKPEGLGRVEPYLLTNAELIASAAAAVSKTYGSLPKELKKALSEIDSRRWDC
jgi:uncharacterized protein